MTSVLSLCLLVVGIGVSQGQAAPGLGQCPPAFWLPEGAEYTSCGTHGVLYDGSKVPDCSAYQDQNSNANISLPHEYGKIWGMDDSLGRFYHCFSHLFCLVKSLTKFVIPQIVDSTGCVNLRQLPV